jgi:antitoxin (DNA-binding transcriptional repressor) of toxin-antitoxin stability system
MEASILDLRYKMKEVLQALERREKVRILYHGKEKGTIIPTDSGTSEKVKEHPFFGMSRKQKRPVSDLMQDLRGGRYNAL